ncbi:tail assembly chaperone [Phage vB_KsaM-C1]|nr:tail assembly chaperone [Phage vB_KsaM-C1]
MSDYPGVKMSVKSFQIGSLTINAAMASALEQDEALSLIGSGIIQRAAELARAGEQTGEQMLTAMFLSMPHQVKQRVSNILLSKALTAGTNTPITVNDFQGKMVQYNTLLAQLTLWNFDDFFIWLGDAVKERAPAPDTTAP